MIKTSASQSDALLLCATLGHNLSNHTKWVTMIKTLVPQSGAPLLCATLSHQLLEFQSESPRDTNKVVGLIDTIRISNWCLTFVPHFESPLIRVSK